MKKIINIAEIRLFLELAYLSEILNVYRFEEKNLSPI